MTDDELKARLSSSITDDNLEDITESDSTDSILIAAERVMASYQNANKWLDIIKEYVLMDLGCVFFSNYIHNLAHTMPARFDKFGDILHTEDITVPYPATNYIPQVPTDIPSVFQQVFDILGAISTSLREFIKLTQDTENHAMACSAEELLVDISGEYTNLYRLSRVYSNCQDAIKFDKYVAHYVNSLGNLID
jgi:hypothetical protein